MKISRISFIRILLWTSLIAFIVIYNAIHTKENWSSKILGSMVLIIFFAGVVYFSYKIFSNISHFLTKLVNNRSDNEIINKAPLQTQPSRLVLPLLNETKYIEHEEIVRCEADNSYTVFHLINNEKILVSKPLKVYADLLLSNGFLRTHQSHLVNTRFVKSWLKEDGGMLLLTTSDKIPISKPNKEVVKRVLQEM